jgi:hypothetical protein
MGVGPGEATGLGKDLRRWHARRGNAVQMRSRLSRICSREENDTLLLNFANAPD